MADAMRYSDAVFAFLIAMVAAAALTPLAARLARRIGAIDFPRARGLSQKPTPKLGGLAIFAGVLVASLIWLPSTITIDMPGGSNVCMTLLANASSVCGAADGIGVAPNEPDGSSVAPASGAIRAGSVDAIAERKLSPLD